MQDYPKSLPPSAPVGFSVVRGTTSFSPVKTNLADAKVKSQKGELLGGDLAILVGVRAVELEHPQQ